MRPIPRSLTAEVNQAFEALRTEMRQYECVEVNDSSVVDRANRATDFVRRWQNSDGSWAQGAMMSTSLALASLSLWTPEIREWKLPSGSQGGFEVAWAWLDNQQEGSVWENIWNTSLICQAAARLSSLNRPSVDRAITWLVRQANSRWGLDDKLPVHHVAQAVICFDSLGMTHERDVAANALLDHLDSRAPLSSYSAGQALQALVVAGVTIESGPGQVLAETAQEALMADHVSISNFVEICTCFKGLGAAVGGVGTQDAGLERTLANFFSAERLQDDGSWYRDLNFTSFALVALTEVRATRQIRTYPTKFYAPLEKARLEIHKAVQAEVHELRLVGLASGAAGMLAVVLAVLVVLQTRDSIQSPWDSEVVWFVAPAMLASIVWLVRYAWVRSRAGERKSN